MHEYRLLGKTGLRVSPLCLGAMTFGTELGWGSAKETARALFDRYLEVGGNFIDTADAYTGGTSEKWVGEFVREAKERDRLVIATKFSFGVIQGDPNSGGNGRKAILRALEGSLKRLQTDYIDLYWLHAWDMLTPVEEVMATLNDCVRQGKVRYLGMSDVPAWYASRAQTIAELRGWEKLTSLQLEYSLVARNLEREHLWMAQDLGMGICAWSPLGQGFLTGKYRKEKDGFSGQGRVQTVRGSGNPVMEKFDSERNWAILEVLKKVANEVERPAAEVAINWATFRPGITSTLIGATKKEQLESNLRSLDFELPPSLAKELETVSRPVNTELDDFFSPAIQGWLRGGTAIIKDLRPRY
ncbi:MAG: aldo/keto reductase [Deltaproteobacteria bacterium]|nr:aldo/keto reductase [Deltaproteobacteria bacterium]